MNSKSKTKSLFITGGTGYIKTYVIKEFIKHGWEITAIVKDPLNCNELEQLRVNLIKGSLEDSDILQKESEDKDAIIHCAQDHGNREKSIELDTLAVNSLLISAKKNYLNRICSFIYTSGTFVYGEGDDVKDESYQLDSPPPFFAWRVNNEKVVLSVNGPEKKFEHCSYQTNMGVWM